MGKCPLKHGDAIVQEFQTLLARQNGVASQDQLLNIVKKYYSESYSEATGVKLVINELSSRKIASLINVKLPESVSYRNIKYEKYKEFFQVLVGTNVAAEDKKGLISALIRDTLPVFVPSMRQTISKDLLAGTHTKPFQIPDKSEFPTIKFRAMILHGFLLKTFYGIEFTSQDILSKIPLHLQLQIIRGIDHFTHWPHLAIISPTQKSAKFEIEMMLPYLRPPYHPLATKTMIYSTANIEIPKYNINRVFDFINDPKAYSQYWLYFFSLTKEDIDQYPLSLSVRFEPFLLPKLTEIPISSLPFFPNEVAAYAVEYGVNPHVISYAVQKTYKRKLRAIHCTREAFLEVKLYPANGLVPFLLTHGSAFPCQPPYYPQSYSKYLKVDDSLRSLAKLYAVSKITSTGYILSKRSNFNLFKDQVDKWISKCDKFSNLFASLKEINFMNSLINNEMANTIQLIHFHMNKPEKAELLEEEKIEPEIKMIKSKSNFALDTQKHLVKFGLIKGDIEEFPEEEEEEIEPESDQEPETEFEEEEDIWEEMVIYFDEDYYDEVTQSQFISTFRVDTRIRDVSVTVASAIEFLKISLLKYEDSASDLQYRQISRFNQKDLYLAVWFLNAIDILNINSRPNRLTFPECKWEFSNFSICLSRQSYAEAKVHPMYFQLMSNEDSFLQLKWNFINNLIEGLQAPIPSLLKRIKENKKKEDDFIFTYERLILPKLGNINIPKFYEDLFDTDQIIQYCFGRIETTTPPVEDFEQRLLLHLINSGNIEGVGIIDLINSFGFNLFDQNATRIMRKIKELEQLDYIVRINSSKIEPRWSRYVPFYKIFSVVSEKVAFRPLHIWMLSTGKFNELILTNIKRSITVYVFNNEGCDFLEILELFSYVSPIDLCMILENLENDEVLYSSYYYQVQGGLFNDDQWIPIPQPEHIEMFLGMISIQGFETTEKVKRNLYTKENLFYNLCIV